MALEWAEIPSGNRGLSNCGGCKQKHYCSWACNNGRKYCETCKESEEGKDGTIGEPEVIRAKVQNKINKEVEEFAQFALNPQRTINLSIGKLATGWVLSLDGEAHVFTSKSKLLDAVNKEMVGEVKPEPKAIDSYIRVKEASLRDRINSFNIGEVVGE